MALKYLMLEHEIVDVDMAKGEHFTEEFLQKNPVGQVPVLEDDGFYIRESVAILQYLADRYKSDEAFYPADLQKRAIVNQIMAFHLSSLYPAIGNYLIYPLIFGLERTEENLEKLNKALKSFDRILEKQNTTYVAGNEVTIADLTLVMGIVCCEGIANLDLSPFSKVAEWYSEFKKTEVWIVAKECLDELIAYAKSQASA
jgi:glutathione S-transferase